jgi:hypothetical protein
VTQALQLLVFVGAIACLIRYGFYRDKQEHPSKPEDAQQSIYFPESRDGDDQEQQRGAAMSRLP